MIKTRLSVNLNKVALIRNARGANFPDLIKVAQDTEAYGAEGITVHPRPDERHVRYADLAPLKEVVTTEFNIEGNPTPDFLEKVLAIRPHQCTLVPDEPGALTSDAGWNTKKHEGFLQDVIGRLHEAGIRVSIFIDPVEAMLTGAAKTGTDRIEFYTGPYAAQYAVDRETAVKPYAEAARICQDLGLGVNAGHDLNLTNLAYLKAQLPNLEEVSIGHALVVDALYYGLQNTVQMYLHALR